MTSGDLSAGSIATEVDADGTALAELSIGDLVVAPSNRFHLEARYAPPLDRPCGFFGGPCQLRVDGILPGGADDTTGRYVLVDGLTLWVSTGDVTITRLGTQ